MGQKSQLSALYYRRYMWKNIVAIWGKIDFLGILAASKHTRLSVTKIKKSALCQSRSLSKIDFWAFLLKIATIIKRFPRVQKFNNFKNTSDYRAKKSIQCAILYAQFEGRNMRNLREHELSGHFWCKNTQDYPAIKIKIELYIIGSFWGKRQYVHQIVPIISSSFFKLVCPVII